MVLGRHPKKYKHFIKILTSQLMIHENIVTTNAKAKHLRRSALKLLKFAQKAYKGETSAQNLLKGRVTTEKVEQKLLLSIIPRLNSINGNYVYVSPIFKRRRGDNAPMVNVHLAGDQKAQAAKFARQDLIEKGKAFDVKASGKKWLLQEKEHYEKLIVEKPEMESFFRAKISRIEFEIWTLNKKKNEPSKFALLV